MKASINNYGDLFSCTLAGVAIGAPMLLVCAVAQLPEGTERGEFMVYGLGTVVAVLVGALVLRAAYKLGFSKALRTATSEPNRSVTA
jgi:hypothetical protein